MVCGRVRLLVVARRSGACTFRLVNSFPWATMMGGGGSDDDDEAAFTAARIGGRCAPGAKAPHGHAARSATNKKSRRGTATIFRSSSVDLDASGASTSMHAMENLRTSLMMSEMKNGRFFLEKGK